MKIKVILISLIIFSSLFSQDIKQYRKYHNKAIHAYYAQDKISWLSNNQKALDMLPGCATNIYYLADAYAQNEQPDSALKYLKMAIEFGYAWNSDKDESFKALWQNPEFLSLMKKVDKMRKPINNSVIGFTISERDLIPEGFAYDPIDNCFYLSSLYKCKIVKIHSNGSYADFTSEKQDGLMPVTGMKVDAERRILWVCSEVSGQNYKDADSTALGHSGIFKYDLVSGDLIRKFIIMEKGVNHLFNDIVVAKNGDVYFTDSDAKKVYRIGYESDRPEVFVEDAGFGYPNGIALDQNEEHLYVADSGPGINRINLKTKEISYLATPKNVTTVGIDGLYFYENSLIAVQNGFGEANRVSRFYLNETGDEVIKHEILEMNNPHFQIPTIGAIADGYFYYIANSQMGSFDNSHNIFPNDKLNDVLIMKVKL